MSIVDKHALVYYDVVTIAFQRSNDGSLVVSSDVSVFNADKKKMDTDHPTPALTTAQRELFRNWYIGALLAYETSTGLVPLPPDGES